RDQRRSAALEGPADAQAVPARRLLVQRLHIHFLARCQGKHRRLLRAILVPLLMVRPAGVPRRLPALEMRTALRDPKLHMVVTRDVEAVVTRLRNDHVTTEALAIALAII